MVATTGSLSPRMRLYRSDGSLLCDRDDIFNDPLVVMECSLEQTGTYSLLVEDWNANDIGNYELYLQNITNLTSATPIGIQSTHR
jgi:hypothetical protein